METSYWDFTCMEIDWKIRTFKIKVLPLAITNVNLRSRENYPSTLSGIPIVIMQMAEPQKYRHTLNVHVHVHVQACKMFSLLKI